MKKLFAVIVLVAAFSSENIVQYSIISENEDCIPATISLNRLANFWRGIDCSRRGGSRTYK